MGNLTTIIAADTTGFKKSVEDARKTLDLFISKDKELDRELRKTNDITENQVNSFNRVNKTLQKVSSGAMSTVQAEKALSAQVKELKIQYANLSDSAKNSYFGKRVQNQCEVAEKYLKQLQQQLEAVKTENEKLAESNNNTSFDKVTDLIKKYAAQLAVASTALKVLKDAFFSSEQNIDDWGRTTTAADTAYRVFCTSLNSGNWSNFFTNLNHAIGGAIELYNTLDRLGSIKTNNQAAIAIVEAELARLRLLKQEGKDVDKQIKEAQAKLNHLKGQEVEAGKKAGRDTIKQAIQTQDGSVNDADAYFMADELINKGQAAFDYYEKRLKELKASAMDWDYVYDDMGNIVSKALVFDEKLLSEADRKRYRAYQAFLDAETPIGKGLEMYANAVSAEAQNAQQQFKYNKWTGAGGGSGSNTNQNGFNLSVSPISIGRTEAQIKAEIKKLQSKIENTPEGALRLKLIADKETLENELKNFGKTQIAKDAANMNLSGVQNATMPVGKPKGIEGVKDGYFGIQDLVGASQQLDSIWNGMFANWEELDFGQKFFTLTDAIFGTIDAINSFIDGIGHMKDMITIFKAVSSAASKQKIAENAAETASEHSKTAAETGSAAAGVFSAHSSIPFVGIAIAIGLIGAMMAVMSQFHNGGIVGKFANGGMIKGNTSIGDMNLARVNSGEMILNGSQQSHLFNLLNSSGGYSPVEGGNVHFRIQGEDLVGVLNNFNRRSNKVL